MMSDSSSSAAPADPASVEETDVSSVSASAEASSTDASTVSPVSAEERDASSSGDDRDASAADCPAEEVIFDDPAVEAVEEGRAPQLHTASMIDNITADIDNFLCIETLLSEVCPQGHSRNCAWGLSGIRDLHYHFSLIISRTSFSVSGYFSVLQRIPQFSIYHRRRCERNVIYAACGASALNQMQKRRTFIYARSGGEEGIRTCMRCLLKNIAP